jgi:2-polyprenyl-3-methyl-5-hydroxy-6-metoxy-1,4-benzoquinol methylase
MGGCEHDDVRVHALAAGTSVIARIRRAIQYRLGRHMVAPDLEDGSDEGVQRHYNSRVSDCSFLADPAHYERPRVDWMREKITGGTLLEIGSADGTVTAMLSARVSRVVALDICQESVERVRARGLANVEGVCGFVEHYSPGRSFDWIVMSEVVEHLRDPAAVIARTLAWLAPGGRLLLSSPDGNWEGDAIEHLHVFDLGSWCAMLVRAGARDMRVFKIQDRDGRDRWLGAEIVRD